MRPYVFTDEGQWALFAYRDAALALLAKAGAFTLGALLDTVTMHISDNFKQLAVIDRRVEHHSRHRSPRGHPGGHLRQRTQNVVMR